MVKLTQKGRKKRELRTAMKKEEGVVGPNSRAKGQNRSSSRWPSLKEGEEEGKGKKIPLVIQRKGGRERKGGHLYR